MRPLPLASENYHPLRRNHRQFPPKSSLQNLSQSRFLVFHYPSRTLPTTYFRISLKRLTPT